MRYKQTGRRWPHMYNGCKYGASMTVTVFGTLHPLYTTMETELSFTIFWLTLFVVSSLFSAYWDIFQVSQWVKSGRVACWGLFLSSPFDFSLSFSSHPSSFSYLFLPSYFVFGRTGASARRSTRT